MFELLFLLSFTLHNLEEALWLPKWSQKYAKKFHAPVQNNEFHFALIGITVLGYLFTFAFLVAGKDHSVFRYGYYGFVLAMCFNSIFPHLIATIAMKRYAPGTITGLFLNLPIGLYLVFVRGCNNGSSLDAVKLIIGFVVVGGLMLGILRPLNKLGAKLIDPY